MDWEQTDPNDQLGPFVEGLAIGALDWPRLTSSLEGVGWTMELTDVDGYGAVVLTTPSGRRWRIRAELLPVADHATV